MTNFTISHTAVRNEGQYMHIELIYPSYFPSETRLRQNILLEFTVSNIRLETEKLPVKTLIEETLEKAELTTPFSIACISIEEIAIEKWVGLTRRIIAIERNYHHDDSTLIRHVYDLNAINAANRITSNLSTIAQAIIKNDVEQFGNQHPEYSTTPFAEIKQSLEILKNKSLWKSRYDNLIETMVYDNSDTVLRCFQICKVLCKA